VTRTASHRSLIGDAWNGFLDVVFPPQCVACRAWGDFLCAKCLPGLSRADGTRCNICWQPGMSPCADCLNARPAFEAVRSAYTFEGPARALVHALKYHGVSAVTDLMAEPMMSRLAEWDIQIDTIVPVPMATMRKRRRGYNQAELLAGAIARATGIPVKTRLIQKRAGPSQVEQPSEVARRQNAAQSYSAGREAADGSVLLIDDAMTTGATLDACANVLLSTGAGRVYGLTFARES
jgi:ComF family protein